MTLIQNTHDWSMFFIRPHLALFSALFFGPFGVFCGRDQIPNTFVQPTNADYQFLFWKCSPTFLFLILPKFGPFLHFLGPSGLFFGVGVRLEFFWDLLMQTINFSFGSTAIYFFFLIYHILGLFCTFLGPLGLPY